MLESLEQLDLLLLHVAKQRRVQQDGIHFQGQRYFDLTLAAYVGEDVIIRYDPRDLAVIRVFYEERFLCSAICYEFAGTQVSLKEVIQARREQRKQHALSCRCHGALLLMCDEVADAKASATRVPDGRSLI